MEKLIIEYYNTCETEKEKEEYVETLSKLMFRKNDDSNEGLKFVENYEKEHKVKTVREYPEALFSKMTNVEELYAFIQNNVGSCCNLKALQTPRSFEKLERWFPRNLKDSKKAKQGLKSNIFSLYSDWAHQKKTDEFFEKLTEEQTKWITETFSDKAD